MINLQDITNSDIFKSAVDLGKTYIAANGKQPIGAMQYQPVVGNGAGGVAYGGARTGKDNPLDTLAQAYAAREANRELNKNPPYWLYGLIGMGLVGLYIVARR